MYREIANTRDCILFVRALQMSILHYFRYYIPARVKGVNFKSVTRHDFAAIPILLIQCGTPVILWCARVCARGRAHAII